jgi:hypothetical protein
MHRITDANRHVDKFGVGKDGFRDGDKSLGVIATRPAAVTFDVFQEELVNAVEAAGITLSSAGGDYAQLREAIKRLAGGMMRGARTGLFSRVSNDQITLSPVSGDKVAVEIDGVLREASSLVWDLTTDLDTGSAVANTTYYAYALVTGGALDTKLSTTPPSTSGKVGYHPTRTSERCIFAMRTKAAAAQWMGFDEQPDGWTVIRAGEYGAQSLGTAKSTSYVAAVSITGIPQTARAVRLGVRARADEIVVHYAHESLAATLVSAARGSLLLCGTTEDASRIVDSAMMDLPVDSTAAITYGVEIVGAGDELTENDITVVGWRNAL